MLTKAQQKLVTANMGIAIRVLTKLNVRRGAGYDDCRSEAMLALVKAAASFDPSRAGFSTWAWLKVTGAVKDWMERESRRSGYQRAPEQELLRLHATETAPDEQAYNMQVVTRVRAALQPGTERMQEVTQLLAFGDMTIRQCAAKMKVTKRAVTDTLNEARGHLAGLKSELGATP